MTASEKDQSDALLNAYNQLDPRLLSVSSMNPYRGASTSPREHMFTGNLGQFQIVTGATERLHQTGAEREYGKRTFNIKSPGNIKVLKVINLYPSKMGGDSFKLNPKSLVIYEDMDTSEIGCIEVENFRSDHPTFGYPYKNAEGFNKIHQGAYLSKGEVIKKSPIVTDDGSYMYGLETNVASMSVPGIAEDGIVVSESYLKRLTYHTYSKVSVELGAMMFPLNLYGNEKVYKIMPEIGEYVRPDGLLVARRKYNEDTALYDQSPHGLMEFQYNHDDPIYVQPGGRLIDVRVVHSPLSRLNKVPVGMDQQLKKYHDANYEYHKAIMDQYWYLYKLRKDSLRITPEFNRVVREAQFVTNFTRGERLKAKRRNRDLDDWYVEFVLEYKNVPGIGFKLTDALGGASHPVC